jgi:glycosyltransferase involved in cell wall biosynthesis
MIAVIIPTLNEEASIGAVVRAVPRDLGRIIVADSGSTDATVARARSGGADVLDVGRGYGRACLAAAQAAFVGRPRLVYRTATAPTTPAASRRSLRPSGPANSTS